MRIAIVVAATCLSLAGLTAAADSQASIKKPITISAQGLGPALQTLAKERGLQVVYVSDEINRHRTRGVSGDLTADEVLLRLLDGTGLTFRYLGDNSVAIMPIGSDAATSSNLELRAREEAAMRLASRNSGSSMRLVRMDADAAARMAAEEAAAKAKAHAKDDDDRQQVDMLVEEKRELFKDRNIDIPRGVNDAQPYYIFDNEQLVTSGALNLDEFLKQRLTMNSTSQSPSQVPPGFGGSARGSSPNINLNGLSEFTVQQTLILVNGRRMAAMQVSGTAGYQPDINGIPLSAIERVEVLPTSASAIYGGSAMGGVVNVILKKDHAGGEIRVNYETPDDVAAPVRKIEGSYGFNLEGGRTNIMLTGSYSDQDPVTIGDRANIIQRNIYRRYENFPAGVNDYFFPPPGSTLNVKLNARTVNGYVNPDNSTLTLDDGTPLNALFTHLPAGISPTTPDSQVAAALLGNAGRYNLQIGRTTSQYGSLSNIGSPSDSHSMGVNIRREMGARWQLFVDYNVTVNEGKSFNPYISSATTAMAGNSPNNPFQQNIYVSIPNDQVDPYSIENETRTFSAGVSVDLPRSWKILADFTRSTNEHFMGSNSNNSADTTTALDTLNPFVDTLMYPLQFPETVANDWLYTGQSFVKNGTLRFSGPLPKLPMGVPNLTVGLETRREGVYDLHTYSIRRDTGEETYNNHTLPYAQKVNNVYAELQLPLVGPEHNVPFVSMLDLQLAGRHDRYEVPAAAPPFGGGAVDPSTPATRYASSNPTFGVRYRPVQSLMFRASYATAFLPPYPSQVSPPVLSNFPATVFDPQLQMSYSVARYTGGDPDLKPQNSKSLNFGVVYEPAEGAFEGLRINVEYYNIRQFDAISTQQPQFFVDAEAEFPGRVVRDPGTGMITSVNSAVINLFENRTRGYNFSIDKRFNTAGRGLFHLGTQATYVTQFDKQVLADQPFFSYLGSVREGGPAKFKLNSTLTWSKGPWTAGWTLYYYGEYYAYGSSKSPNRLRFPNSAASYDQYLAQQGSETIPSQIYNDVYARYAFPERMAGGLTSMLAGVTVQMGIKNLFDEVPPYEAYIDPYYVSTYGDLRLRSWTLSLRKAF